MIRPSQYLPFNYAGGSGAKRYRPAVAVSLQAATLLKFIVAYQQEHGGVSPSFPEMAAGANLSGKSSVHRALAFLTADGRIRTMPHRARAIEVMGERIHAPRVPLTHPSPEAQFFVVEKPDGGDAHLVEMERR